MEATCEVVLGGPSLPYCSLLVGGGGWECFRAVSQLHLHNSWVFNSPMVVDVLAGLTALPAKAALELFPGRCQGLI